MAAGIRITGGEFRGRRIGTLEAPGYRPATAKVREAIFNMLSARGVRWESARVLDVFAGSGALGIEALSRGARFACFVEMNRAAAALIARSLGELGVSRARTMVIAQDAAGALAKQPKTPYDVVFVDPPYREDLAGKTLAQLSRRGHVAPGGIVLAEIDAAEQVAAPVDFRLDTEKTYGQTRICIWTNDPAPQSTPGPSTP
jgi:16S rRNA (guanine966-N2)-methyltransferase